jgi:hypothetical protein
METRQKQENTMHNNVLAQVAGLPKLSVKELQKLWRDVFGEEPRCLQKTWLVRRLAYRLQEIAYSTDTAKLEKVYEEAANGKACRKRNRSDDVWMPVAGTRLTREWQGEEHQVTVLVNGFDYRGQRYRSLSIIARTITGVRWSGPRFFGLKREAA